VTQLLSSLLTALIAAPVAAWLAARFALRRFYSEKVWERKTVAYTVIFDALHDMRRWFNEHWHAEEMHREVPEDVRAKLLADYREAEARLARQLDRERWLLPSACSERLAQMQKELDQASDSWRDRLGSCSNAINSALNDMRTLARDDLQIDRPKLYKVIFAKFRNFAANLGR
jgi:hypothetical protein